MKKIIGIIILAIIIVLIAIWVFKTPIVSYVLSKKLKVPVSIGKLTTKKDQVIVDNFKIKNPKGYKEKTAFSTKNILVSFDIENLKKSPSTIDDITFTDNYLLISCDSPICSENNWTAIIEGISKKDKKMAGKKEIVIENLEFKNLTVDILHLGLVPGNKKRMHFDSLKLKNINSKDGFPTSQIIAALFKKAYLMDYVKDIFDKTQIFDKYFKSWSPLSENESFDSEIEYL